jgi:hypothetical protein
MTTYNDRGVFFLFQRASHVDAQPTDYLGNPVEITFHHAKRVDVLSAMYHLPHSFLSPPAALTHNSTR